MTADDLKKITAARARVERAQADLRVAIVTAFNDREGHTVTDIAEAAGLSRERVYQVVKEEKERAADGG